MKRFIAKLKRQKSNKGPEYVMVDPDGSALYALLPNGKMMTVIGRPGTDFRTMSDEEINDKIVSLLS